MVLVEVMRKAYLASIVPVIVNSILNEHQVIVDIIAFVSKGDFPRSRLGEKQRGKILASWVTRKMRTIAQFGIRDADGADSQITEVAEPRSRVGSVLGKGSSLRNVETVDARSMNTREAERQQQNTQDHNTLPPGVSDMPAAHYESSIIESPPLANNEDDDPDETPMNPSTRNSYFHFEKPAYNESEPTDASPSELPTHSYEERPYNPLTITNPTAGPAFEIASAKSRHTPPARLVLSSRDSLPSQNQQPRLQQSVASTGASERSSSHQSSSHQYDSGGRSVGGGRLRVANADSDHEEQTDWPQEALMHMNLTNTSSSGGGGSAPADKNHAGWDGYDGRGYGNAL